jgi:two-component system response regulator
MPPKFREVLLVEDDAGDVDLTKEALKEGKIQIKVNVVEDGVQAMAYLHKKGRYANARQPDLILLDLNLPKKDGRQVLREIKSDENLKDIPVVVLSTSKADRDIHQSYNGGVNCYVTKPVEFEQFSQVIKSIMDYWFRVAKLPPR